MFSLQCSWKFTQFRDRRTYQPSQLELTWFYLFLSGVIPLIVLVQPSVSSAGGPFHYLYTPFVDVMNGVSMKGLWFAAPIDFSVGVAFNWSLKRKERVNESCKRQSFI